jgi:polyisoprenoid-binding protein YceI
MKLSGFALSAFAALAISSAPSFALELEVDTAHSSIGFDIKHLVISTVHGAFTEFNGALELNEQDFTRSKVSFNVKNASINTANAKRDEHLRGADFFDVQKFPETTFTSTAIRKAGKKYVLEGDLSLHGVTKKVSFDLVSLGKIKDMQGVEKHAFQASTVLKRKEFGLVYNAALETGGLALGEDVKLTVDLETAAKKSEAKAEKKS